MPLYMYIVAIDSNYNRSPLSSTQLHNHVMWVMNNKIRHSIVNHDDLMLNCIINTMYWLVNITSQVYDRRWLLLSTQVATAITQSSSFPMI